MSLRINALAAAAVGLCLPLTSQQLVRDIAQSGDPASSSPVDFVTAGGFACFVADTGDAGREPWVTNGTTAGTFRLLDAMVGPGSSNPSSLVEYQGDVLFLAATDLGVKGYRTDGTVAGTTEIPNLGLLLSSLVVLDNGTLLVNASIGTYITDLTLAGTQQIPGMRNFVEELAVGGISYGTCSPTTGVSEVWRTDGTVAGSQRLGVFNSSMRPSAFTFWNNRIYMQVSETANSNDIASTNGTQQIVRHVSLGAPFFALSDSMYGRGNALVFAYGNQIYRSDLTQAGTAPVTTPAATLVNLVEHAGRLFCRADSQGFGFELWETDGTSAGTFQVADLFPGSNGSHPEHLLSTPAGLVFRANLPTVGRRLMRLTGTNTITDLGAIPDDAPAGVPVTSVTSGFVPFQNGLLFGGTDAVGTELWFWNGSQPATRLADLDQSGPGLLHAANGLGAAVKDRFFFTAYEPVNGLELWSTDGTAAGTTVIDQNPGGASEFPALGGDLARFGDRAVFASQRRVGITDGTAAGTVTLTSTATPANYGPLRVADGEIWFLRGSQAFRSDGTVGGTTPAPFFAPNTTIDFAVMPGRIVFQTVATLRSSDGLSQPQVIAQIGFDGTLHRLAEDRLVVTSSSGILVTDGTLAGTQQLETFGGSFLRSATGARAAYIVANDGSGPAIWTSDGTPAGTFSAAPVPLDMNIAKLVATDNMLYAVASTPALGRELWRLDFTAGQLVPVTDLATGPTSGVLTASALGVGDLVFVAGGDPAIGIEPHISDGTAAGTVLLTDLHAGSGVPVRPVTRTRTDSATEVPVVAVCPSPSWIVIAVGRSGSGSGSIGVIGGSPPHDATTRQENAASAATGGIGKRVPCGELMVDL